MKPRFYMKLHGLGCGSFADQQIPEPKRRQSTLHCFSATLMVILLWSVTAPVHACVGDGCSDWCEEVPSVYFIRPWNDSRTNLALILEDSQVLRLKVEDIPFHYTAFAENNAQLPSPGTQENKDSIEFAELALRLGVRQVEPADIALPDVKKPAEAVKPIAPTAEANQKPVIPAEVVKPVVPADAKPVASFDSIVMSQAQPEGRCVSNGFQTVLAFWRGLDAANDIPASDKQLLAQERLRLLGFCEKAVNSLPVLQVSSEAAKPYADYLRAAAYFYAGKFDELVKDADPAVKSQSVVSFKVLSTSSQVWVKETATYMLGRVYLNQAQKDFQLYSEKSRPDSTLLAKARDQFKTYLAAYPQGLYAASARGLFRKIYWLDNNVADLTKTYDDQLVRFRQQATDSAELLAFIDELESKYSFNDMDKDFVWDSPILATVSAFVAMRPDPNHTATKPIESYLPAALQTHKDSYTQAGLAAVHDYLALAYHFYIERDFAKVIQLTDQPITGTALSNTEFSTQVLRGLSLGALGQWDKTEKLWLELFPRSQKSGQQIQLQWLLAMTWQQENQLTKIYRANSPTKNQKIHDFFIRIASPALLETVLVNKPLNPTTRTLAYRTLLTKLLLHRQYREFLRIAKRYPDTQFEGSELLAGSDMWWLIGSQFKYESENTCPNLLKLMSGLSKNPASATLLNCYGDLMDQVYLPSAAYPGWEDTALSSYTLESYYPAGQSGLKKEADGFKGKSYSSMDLYREVIDQRGSKADAKAYALHKALTCYATTGYNHCGTQDIPIKQRADWFRLLKTVYKDTTWAKQQKYYW